MADLQITIDDGPAPVASALTPILSELKTRGVVAAFFVLGQEVRSDVDAAKAILAAGHVLGNHSWDHLEPSTKPYSNTKVLAQFKDTHAEVLAKTQVKMEHWRAPRLDDWERLQRILTTGPSPLYTLTHCDWQADSRDALGAKTVSQMLANIRAEIAVRPGRKFYRLLFHVLPHTAKALPEVLNELTQKDHHKLVDFAQIAPVIIRPSKPEVQLIAGIIYAMSATGGRASDAQRAAIGATIANRAHHARCVNKPGGGSCANSIFGDGTILGALKQKFVAYDNTPGKPWAEVMKNDAMRPSSELDALPESKRFRLEYSITAAESLDLTKMPISQPAVGGTPVAFNQAADSPPSPRMKRIGAAGKYTFYGFKTGRECG